MAIYAIADLHLSLNNPKPMDIFGNNWKDHHKKIMDNWINTVKDEDTVLSPGDFSWETYLEETEKDFRYLNELPGTKVLLKGNHDYWWTTKANIKKYLMKNSFNTIKILHNNSYEIENYIIAGTRGWDYSKKDEKKIIEREINRLQISLDSAKSIKNDKEIIVCMHYPPISKNFIENEYEQRILNIFKEYGVKQCIYGHLHGTAHGQAVIGIIEGIKFQLVSADFLDFKLLRI